MPVGEALEDDYIISLLKKDADEHKKRHSTNGPSLTTAKRRPDAPKPNTRFLKNIIRETDSHNAALKAKEEDESRARLRELKRDAESAKRKRDDGHGEREGKRRREKESRPGRWASALGLDGARDVKARKERRMGKDATRREQANESTTRREKVDDKRRESSRERLRHRHRRSHSDEESRNDRHRDKRRTNRSRSREKRASPHHRKEHRRRRRSRSRSPTGDHASDSDPLTEFLGPEPPSGSLPRGRGAFKPSTMDSRFRKDYDPSADVALDPDDEGDDWDMALEALQARTKWRAQGAERLRAAGFTEDEVKRWEKSGGASGSGRAAENDVEDVRWAKKGEGREWDRGKVLSDEDDGHVSLKAEWAK